jgi:osmotically-inducible protein OsmY
METTSTSSSAKNTRISDEVIQREVQAELKWDARVSPAQIGVSVKDQVVALTGWVDSFLKRCMASAT